MMERPRFRFVHAAAIFVICFGVVFAVNAMFVVYALKTFPGEDEARSYAQGLAYNATLRDRRAQAALGWGATAALAPAPHGGALVELTVRDNQAHPLAGLKVKGVLRRPTKAELDRPLSFSTRGDGRYVATLAGLAPGQWVLEVRAVQVGGQVAGQVAGQGGDQGSDQGDRHLDIEKRLIWQPTAHS